jgi:hypothetical protein
MFVLDCIDAVSVSSYGHEPGSLSFDWSDLVDLHQNVDRFNTCLNQICYKFVVSVGPCEVYSLLQYSRSLR